MPKYYCDYCDVFLTHDSLSVRKSHNEGWKHKAIVRNYYAQFEQDETQDLINQKIKEYELRQHTGPMLPFLGLPPAPFPSAMPGLLPMAGRGMMPPTGGLMPMPMGPNGPLPMFGAGPGNMGMAPPPLGMVMAPPPSSLPNNNPPTGN